MVLRLVMGILAVTFLPLGIVFVVIGLVVDQPDKGDPAAFVFVGAALGVAGLACTAIFAELWRREAERRRRRQAGLRARVRVVAAHMNPSVRAGSRIAMNLTVELPGGPATTMVLVSPARCPQEGSEIEVLYDPADPTNFEPVLP